MKRYKVFFIGLLAWVLITACAPDPRKEAEAFSIREQADQDALNQEQNRAQAQELHKLQMQDLQVQQGHKEATAREWRTALNNAIHIGSWFAIAALCYAFFMTARAYSLSVTGLAEAIVQAAELKANLISLDPTTRQFPLVIRQLGDHIFVAFNPNTDSVRLLDANHSPDRQMISAMGVTQYVGALAREARQASDPTGVAIINPPVIDAVSEDLTVGKNVIQGGRSG